MQARPIRFIICCPHGGNRIPAAYRHLFAGAGAQLRSHRGYDSGALTLARELAAAVSAPLFCATTSRLLIDLNRSPRHPGLYSEFTRLAPRAIRAEIFASRYLPHRERIERCIADAIAEGWRVIHVAVHSFTPQLGDELRNADVAFLYDPSRPPERAACIAWMTALRQRRPDLRQRRNYPYAGRADGFPTWLRRRYAVEDYVGIELEVNQRQVIRGGTAWRQLRADIVVALKTALGQPNPGSSRVTPTTIQNRSD